jgi:hypothetical protein
VIFPSVVESAANILGAAGRLCAEGIPPFVKGGLGGIYTPLGQAIITKSPLASL